ncbi:MAG: S24/S26 family peptidase [Nitrospirae bacterium]|nr:S24/S26 family peptidase [Nitrospirota bacterium]
MPTLTARLSDVRSNLPSHGYRIRFHVTGRSMLPTIHDGDCIIVEPIIPTVVRCGDILLCRTRRGLLAHRVVRIEREPSLVSRISGEASDEIRFTNNERRGVLPNVMFVLRGDASTSTDDPVHPEQVVGRVVAVEQQGALNSLIVAMKEAAYAWLRVRCA